MFEALGDRLQGVFDGLNRQGKLTEEDINVAMRAVRLALLEADVNFRVVKDFVKRVKARSIGGEVMRNITPGQQVVKIVHDELVTTLGEPGRLNLGVQHPTVIMLVGLQGAGKTTMAAKMALFLRRRGSRPLLVGADVYRPAAIDQLHTLGKQLQIPVYDEGVNGNPSDICFNGIERAKKMGNTVVILDTAGRLNIDEMKMDELRDIKARCQPIEILLVADAMTGQEAVRVATDFSNAVDVTGLIMTKVDGDSRGGAAISMRAVTGVPIKFLGVGEKMDALQEFHPDRLAQRILGMGDVLTLVERAQMELDQEEAQKAGEKLMSGKFDLEDFLGQMQQIKKLGPISSLMEMLPGMGQMTKDVDMSNAEKDLARIEAIIYSMTPDERRNPKLLKASRKRRIAAGSGTTIQEINQLLRQFRDMQSMMKKMRKGGRRGMMNMLRGLGM
ncbi:MAG: signal recognition particle protein [Candidatus Promineifilaceae bacterium]